MVDHARMYGENSFHTMTEADFPDRDGFTHTGVITRNHDSFESLKALFVAFLDLDVDADGVSATKHGSIRAEILVDVFA
jgi:hypothetical protein